MSVNRVKKTNAKHGLGWVKNAGWALLAFVSLCGTSHNATAQIPNTGASNTPYYGTPGSGPSYSGTPLGNDLSVLQPNDTLFLYDGTGANYGIYPFGNGSYVNYYKSSGTVDPLHSHTPGRNQIIFGEKRAGWNDTQSTRMTLGKFDLMNQRSFFTYFSLRMPGSHNPNLSPSFSFFLTGGNDANTANYVNNQYGNATSAYEGIGKSIGVEIDIKEDDPTLNGGYFGDYVSGATIDSHISVNFNGTTQRYEDVTGTAPNKGKGRLAIQALPNTIATDIKNGLLHHFYVTYDGPTKILSVYVKKDTVNTTDASVNGNDQNGAGIAGIDFNNPATYDYKFTYNFTTATDNLAKGGLSSILESDIVTVGFAGDLKVISGTPDSYIAMEGFAFNNNIIPNVIDGATYTYQSSAQAFGPPSDPNSMIEGGTPAAPVLPSGLNSDSLNYFYYLGQGKTLTHLNTIIPAPTDVPYYPATIQVLRKNLVTGQEIRDDRFVVVPNDATKTYESYFDAVNTPLPGAPNFGNELVVRPNITGDFSYRVYMKYDDPTIDLTEPLIVRQVIGGYYTDTPINPSTLRYFPGGRQLDGAGAAMPLIGRPDAYTVHSGHGTVIPVGTSVSPDFPTLTFNSLTLNDNLQSNPGGNGYTGVDSAVLGFGNGPVTNYEFAAGAIAPGRSPYVKVRKDGSLEVDPVGVNAAGGTYRFHYLLTVEDNASPTPRQITGRIPFRITVLPVTNIVANDDVASTPENTSVSIPVLSNDTLMGNLFPNAPWSNPGVAYSVSVPAVIGKQPYFGSVSISGGNITYTPNTHYNGPDVFRYTVTVTSPSPIPGNPANVETAEAFVYVNVTPVTTPIVANPDYYSTPEDTPLVIATPFGVTPNDIDRDYFPLCGTPAAYPWIADYGNDRPAITSPVYPAFMPNLLGLTCAPAPNWSVMILTQPANGIVNLDPDAKGGFVYIPNHNYRSNGTPDTFTYRITDSNTARTATTTVYITVAGVNDAPQANNDVYYTNVNTPLTNAGPVTSNDFDPDNTPTNSGMTTHLITPPSHASSFTQNPNGTFNYTPATDYVGTDSYTYQVVDAQGAQSNIATVYIVVNPVQQPPVAQDLTYTINKGTSLTVGAPGLFNYVTDPNGDIISIYQSSSPANGVVVINGNGSFTYTPQPNFTGTNSFNYTVLDSKGNTDTAIITINVIAGYVPPVALNYSYTTTEGTPVNATPFTVPAGQTVQLVGSTTNGGLTFVPATATNPQSFTYTPAAGFIGADSFTYKFNDGTSDSNIGTVTIVVLPAVQVLTAVNDFYTLPSNGAYTVPTGNGVKANDSNTGAGISTPVVTKQPEHGTLVFNNDGSFVYTPNPYFKGVDTFEYFLKDNLGNVSNFATAYLTVPTVVPAVTAIADFYETDYNTPLTVPAVTGVLTNEINPYNYPLTAHIVSNAGANGLINIANDGSFVYTPNNGFSGIVTISYVAISELGESPAVIVIRVKPALPTAPNRAFSTPVDTTLNNAQITTLASGAFNLGSVVPQFGSVVFTNDGLNHTFNYTPLPGYTGLDSFTYTITDSNGNTTSEATVTILVTPVNAPVANNDFYAYTHGTPLDITYGQLRSNDAWSAGALNTLTPVQASLPIHGTLVRSGNTFTYEPFASVTTSVTDSFQYFLQDGSGNIVSNVATVYITVPPVPNRAPITGFETYFATPGQTITGNVLTNDYDPDGDSIEAILQIPGPLGSNVSAFNLNLDGTFSMTLTPSATGMVVFQYQARDIHGNLSPSQIVFVNIVTPNLTPIAVNDTYATPVGTSLNVGSGSGLLSNDVDPDGVGFTLIDIKTHPVYGDITYINNDGSFVYELKPAFINYTGIDTFTYTVTDANGDESNVATVTINIIQGNRAPVANDDNYAVQKNGVLNIPAVVGVLTNDNDPDGDTFSAVLDSTPGNGTVSFYGNGGFIYTPNANYTGTDFFTYHVVDSNNTQSNVATINIVVSDQNNGPQGFNDGYFTPQGQTLTVAAPGVLVNDLDLNGDALSAVLLHNPQHGTLNLNADGSFVYTPDANFAGPFDTFYYLVSDGKTFDPNPIYVQINIGGVNRAPVANDDVYTVAAETTLVVPHTNGFLNNDSDPDGNLDYNGAQLVNDAQTGTVNFGTDGSFDYTPNTGFTGTDFFTYKVQDADGVWSNIAKVTINVTAVNHAPIGTSDYYITLKNTPIAVGGNNLLANDFDQDGNTLTAYLVPGSQTAGAIVNVFPNGTFSYVPVLDHVGPETFEYMVTDGQHHVGPITVTIDVLATNDKPVAVNDAYIVAQGQVLSIAAPGVMSNDLDPDAAGITAAIVANGNYGDVVLLPTGEFTYTIKPEFAAYVGPDTFTYQITDNGGDVSNIATVTITIVAVNRAPVAANDTYVINKNGVLVVDDVRGVTANDIDPDGDTLIASVVSNPISGSNLVLYSNGGFVYTPAPGFSGPDTFEYLVNDGTTNSNIALVTINVTDLNQPPVGNDDAYFVQQGQVLTVNAPGVLLNDTDPNTNPLTAVLRSNPDHGTLVFNTDGSFVYTADANFPGPSVTFSYYSTDGEQFSGVVWVTININAVNRAPVAVNDIYSVTNTATLNVPAANSILNNDVDPDGGAITAIVVNQPQHGTLTTFSPDGSFVYTPTVGYTGVDFFTYKANDGALDSNIATVTINVKAANRAPVAITDTYVTSKNGIIDFGAQSLLTNDIDPDGDSIRAFLVGTPSNQATVEINPNGTFRYIPAYNFSGPATFTYKVSDGELESNTATVNITVRDVNTAPVAVDDVYSMSQDTVLNTSVAPVNGVTRNDYDPDGSLIYASVVHHPQHGELSTGILAPTGIIPLGGGFTYTPAPGFVGTDTFTYRVNDAILPTNGLYSNVATVTINVRAVNHEPVGLPDFYTTSKNVAIVNAPTVLANDTDVDGDTLSVYLTAYPNQGGIVSLNPDGTFYYKPVNGYVGPETFSYRITDGQDHSVDHIVVTIDVRNDNTAPVANNDAFSTPMNVNLVVPAPGFLGNDTDASGDPLTYVLVDNVQHGILTLTGNGGFEYQPDLNYVGPDSFTYYVNDGKTNSANATVTITVGPKNEAPIANNDQYFVVSEVATTINAPGVLGNDTDANSGDTLVVANPNANYFLNGPYHGTLALNADGSFTYTSNNDYIGTDTFQYQVNDGTANSNLATVTIFVSKPAGVPLANDDAFTTNENQSLTVDVPGVLGNDFNYGLPLRAVQVSQPANGNVVLKSDGSFVYTPNPNYNNDLADPNTWDTFEYKAVSDDGEISSTGFVRIHVRPVNLAPVANNDLYYTVQNANPFTVLAVNGVLANDTDTDSLHSDLQAFIINQPLHGTVELDLDGTFRYTPNADFVGEDYFTYFAYDQNGGISAPATVTIRVKAVNRNPVAVNGTFSTPENVTLNVVAPGILMNVSDQDGDALSVVLVDNVKNGKITLNADGSFVYVPNANYNGTDDFSFKAWDGIAWSNIAIITINVGPVNNAPVANNDVYTVTEDVLFSADNITINGVLANDTDADNVLPALPNAGLTAIVVDQPLHGTLTFNTDGSFTYMPNGQFVGQDSFTYRASDSLDLSNVATVTLNVQEVSYQVESKPDLYSTQENLPLNVVAPGVLANDFDYNGKPISATIAGNPVNGTVVLNADGSFLYTPNQNYSGTDTFYYYVTNGDGAVIDDQNPTMVTILIGDKNFAPMAVGDHYRVFENQTLTVNSPGLLVNDSDPDNDPLTTILVQPTLYGTVTVNTDGSFSYIPNLNFFGSDYFTYQVSDGVDLSNVVRVDIDVVKVDIRPAAVDDEYATPQNVALHVVAPGVLGNDVDPNGGKLTARVITNPSSGTLTLLADGSFIYEPWADFTGTDSFTYTVNNGVYDDLSPATVLIHVYRLNKAPMAAEDVYTGFQDQVLSVPVGNGVLKNDVDPDRYPSTMTAYLINQPQHGSVVLNSNGSFDYTPEALFVGDDYFTYRAYDGNKFSEITKVRIKVQRVQYAPVGVDDSYVVAENKTLIVAAPGVLGNDYDLNGDKITAILNNHPSHGNVVLNADGSFVYVPDANYFGPDEFKYYANDGKNNSNLVVVTINVVKLAQKPIAVDDHYVVLEDDTLTVAAPGILSNDYDVNNDPLTAELITGPLFGTLTFNADGSFVYVPNAHYNGSDSFKYRATNGTLQSDVATVHITVIPVNQNPVLSNTTVTTPINEGSLAVFSTELSDIDINDTHLVTVDWGDGSAPTVQTVQIGTPRITASHLYVDNAQPVGSPYTITVTALDQNGGSDTVSLPIMVNNVAPELHNVVSTPSIPRNGIVELSGQIVDPGVLDTFTMVIDWGNGNVETTNHGPGGSADFKYTQQYTATGTYTITVTVTDKDGGQVVITRTVEVYNSADVILTKTANPNAAMVDEIITYSLIVQNNGPDTATNVILLDTLPANVEVTSSTPKYVEADGVLTWFLPDMEPGQTIRVDLMVKTLQFGPVTNYASVYHDEHDPNPENNHSSVTTMVGPQGPGPDLHPVEFKVDTLCTVNPKKGPRCNLKVNMMIGNRGDEKALKSKYTMYLSESSDFNPAKAMKMSVKKLPALKAGKVVSRKANLKTPYNVTTTGKYLVLVLDDGNMVIESNETNNILVYGPLP